MPAVTRMAQKMEAKEMRAAGQPITLLIKTGSAEAIKAPFNISQANVSLDLTLLPKVLIYGKVRWHTTGEIKYGEGGRTIYRKADITSTSEWMPLMISAVAVILQDGTIMEKVGEELSDTNATYCLVVEGYQSVQQ